MTRMVRDEVLYLLEKYKIHPKKKSGQHFLIDDDAFDSILGAADLGPRDAVLEVGAGIGTLTARLCAAAGRILTVESDRTFEPILVALQRLNPGLVVQFGDFLTMPYEAIREGLGILGRKRYVIVANIPYYITARLIRRVMGFATTPSSMTLLIQKEVAERIVATDGHHSKLSLAVHLYGTPRIVCAVKPESFYPAPEVDSAVLTVKNIKPWRHDAHEKFVWQLIGFAFSSKRKKLSNNLAAGLQLTRARIEDACIEAGVSPDSRAEHVSPTSWISLARALSSIDTPKKR